MGENTPTIGLLCVNPTARQLLVGFVGELGYRVWTLEPMGELPTDLEGVDLILADEAAAQRYGEGLLALKKQRLDAFLPLVILLPHGAEDVPWLERGFDGAVRLPTTKRELRARLVAFLRLRKQSRVLAMEVLGVAQVENGQTVGVSGFAHDITARVQAEQALQQANERLRILREIDRAILTAESPEVIAGAALERLRRLVPCRRASVVVFDMEAQEALVLATHVDGATRLGSGQRISLSEYGGVVPLHP